MSTLTVRFSFYKPADNDGEDNGQLWGTAVNANFDAIDTLLNCQWGRKDSTTTGLTWGYYGGTAWSGAAWTTVADGTVALTASNTNYVERTAAGVVSANTSGFSAAKYPMAKVVTDGSGITSWTDARPALTPSSGSVGGSDTQFQYNNAGSMAGAANFLYVGGVPTFVIEAGWTSIATPSTPSSGLKTYAKSFGRPTLTVLDADGIEHPLGANRAHKGWMTVRPNGVNGGFSAVGIATAASAAGSATPAFATTNLQTSLLASQLTTATTTNASAYVAYTGSGSPWWWRGNAAGLGGMYVVHRFSQNVNTTGSRFFVGMASTLPLSSSQDPSNTTGANKLIGVGYDSGDASTANWQIYHSDGTTCIRVDTGIQRNTTDVLELIIYCAPNDSGFTVLFRNLSTGAVFAPAKYTTNIPANTQNLGPIQWVNTGSVSGTAQKLLFYSWDLETP